MGWMFIWIEVEDKGKGRRHLKDIMREVCPGVTFWIE